MREEIINSLVELKTFFVKQAHKNVHDDIDLEQLEYIINILDCILTNKIDLNKFSINCLIEEIIVTSIYQINPKMMSTVKILQDMVEELR